MNIRDLSTIKIRSTDPTSTFPLSVLSQDFLRIARDESDMVDRFKWKRTFATQTQT